MKIDILCDSPNHPIIPFIQEWINSIKNHQPNLIFSSSDLRSGDILFLISCGIIIAPKQLELYKRSFVIHASDLPKGKGWSPLIWQVLEGKKEVIISLIEANKKVDSGDIIKKATLKIEETDLYDEINQKLFQTECELMKYTIDNFDSLIPTKQNHTDSSYYEKRTASDSEIDIKQSIESQFNLLRICDPERYPAFFFHKGQKYVINIKKGT